MKRKNVTAFSFYICVSSGPLLFAHPSPPPALLSHNLRQLKARAGKHRSDRGGGGGRREAGGAARVWTFWRDKFQFLGPDSLHTPTPLGGSPPQPHLFLPDTSIRHPQFFGPSLVMKQKMFKLVRPFVLWSCWSCLSLQKRHVNKKQNERGITRKGRKQEGKEARWPSLSKSTSFNFNYFNNF